MKKEHVAIAVIGMFLLTYLLDAVSDPLSLPLAHPYQYLNNSTMAKYPFTTASIFIRTLAIILIPFLFFSFLRVSYAAKGGIFLVLGVLMQLYSVQLLTTSSNLVPLEWGIALAFSGAVLLVFSIYYLIIGLMVHTHKKMRKSTKEFETYTGQDPDEAPEWLDENETKK